METGKSSPRSVRRRRKGSMPSLNSKSSMLDKLGPCGKCGYDATGLASPLCPECNNAVDVFVVSNGRRRRAKEPLLLSIITGITFGCLIFPIAPSWITHSGWSRFGIPSKNLSDILTSGSIPLVAIDALLVCTMLLIALRRKRPLATALYLVILILSVIICGHAFITTLREFTNEFMFIT